MIPGFWTEGGALEGASTLPVLSFFCQLWKNEEKGKKCPIVAHSETLGQTALLQHILIQCDGQVAPRLPECTACWRHRLTLFILLTSRVRLHVLHPAAVQ